jgi:hypothetical protein
MARGIWSLDFNLKMLNLWIGLCKGDPGLPDAIATMGFRQHVIEQSIRNEDGSVCVPELICFSKKESHTLVFEWKSGKNSVEDQLARYNQLSSVSLTNVAMVPRQAARAFDVVVVCLAEHLETVKIGILKGGYRFPMLSVDGVGLHLAHNQFTCRKLNEVFAPTLPINFELAPTGHVPINEYSEDWEVAEVVIPKVIEKMMDRQTLIRASSICNAICPLWDNMQVQARRAMQKRVCEILQQAAAGEFASFFYWRKRNEDCEADFVHNPVAEHGAKRQGALKRLRNNGREFRERLARGEKFTSQGTLFDGTDE